MKNQDRTSDIQNTSSLPAKDVKTEYRDAMQIVRDISAGRKKRHQQMKRSGSMPGSTTRILTTLSQDRHSKKGKHSEKAEKGVSNGKRKRKGK